MSKKYLITLTPMGSYYFGGERSFKMGDNDESEMASYIVESNLFPQQTSLLGMLRFWVLRNDSKAFDVQKNRIKDNIKAEELIGINSFSADNDNSFGKIEKIGFCFLQKIENNKVFYILPTPLDYGLEVCFSESIPGFYNGKSKSLPTIKYLDKVDENGKKVEYTSKEGLIKGYTCSNGEFIKEEDIFKRDQRIGIKRDIMTGLTENNALYKQIFYRLEEGFRFAFCAEFSDDFPLPTQGQLVELGGDSSKFILNYEEWDDKSEVCYNENCGKKQITDRQADGKSEVCYNENEKIKAPQRIYAKATLLSDTLLDNSVVETYSLFSIAEHVPFRFLHFIVQKTDNYSRTKNSEKGSRFSLFRRGSVFYFKDETQWKEFKKRINNPIFTNIGYNNYQPNTAMYNDSNK